MPALLFDGVQVPPDYALADGPVHLQGSVVHGLGRGSKQMGTPTANLDPAPLASTLRGLNQGVYFGWVGGVAPTALHSCSSCAALLAVWILKGNLHSGIKHRPR